MTQEKEQAIRASQTPYFTTAADAARARNRSEGSNILEDLNVAAAKYCTGTYKGKRPKCAKPEI